MPAAVHTRRTIDSFLAKKRIAFAGLSRESSHFSRMLFREFVKRGYDAIPVNPGADEIEGHRCYATVGLIEPPPEGVLVLTQPEQTDGIVAECAEHGIREVWMYQATGAGAVSQDAVDFCVENGIAVVAGECPFMFLSETQWMHRLHGGILRIIGKYPAP